MPCRTGLDCALRLGCAFVLSAASAFAEPAANLQVVLEYQTDPTLSECPSAAELSRVIREQLGYDPFVAAAPHHVKASIERAASGTEAHVAWLDADGHSEGERRLGSESGDCAELGRGLAFAIAVQIQLRASSEVAPPAPPAPPPPAPKAPPKAPPTPPPRTTIVMAGVGVLGQHGLTPGSSAGLRIFGSLGSARTSLELSTEATLPTEQNTSERTGFSARSLGAKLAPCAHAAPLGFCGLGMLDLLSVRGRGVDHIESPSALVAGAGLRVQLLWPEQSSVAALLHAEAVVLFTPRAILLNREQVWSTAPVVLSAGLDLAAIFR